MPRRILRCIVLFLAVAALSAPGAAHAHTRIELTSPRDGAHLEAPPAALQVAFSEPLPLRDTDVEVTSAAGEVLVSGPLTSDSTDPAVSSGTLDLPALSDGSYLVTVAAQGPDGHSVRSVFAFAVGDAPVVRIEGGGSPSNGPVARALAALGALATGVGLVGLGFGYVATWVWPGSTRSGRARVHTAAGAGAVLLGAVLVVASMRVEAYPSLGSIAATQAGRLLGLRMAAATAVLAAMIAWSRHDEPDRPRSPNRQNALFAAAIPLLLGVVGSSHSAGDVWALMTLLVGMVHLGAVSLWIGGLAWLWLGARQREPDPEAAAAFSRTARNCAVVTLGTGSVLAYRLTDGLDVAALTSPYGAVLAAKLVFVAALVACAARTHRAVLDLRRPAEAAPHSVDGGGTATRVRPVHRRTAALRSALRREAAAGSVVLVLAALLTTLAPT
ncbi:copper resistance protein CopC/CopD [Phycicoccus sp. CSK15P-2]|uniref:copper resistance CopC/CopD family protein n=1 Tax=Phycicoccus sp. CSK15P-2 TaxID=2807627 RepID=UPI0019510C36|nr:copper resistance protein CopC [Phycicoccus sp. CSK15P-2]MBM6405610.1 copper resistance protein CopC/CopD [Phycicoccus sp. CSK15P-2]